MPTYERWFISQADLENMTPLKARNLICRCFFEAQKENFAGAAHMLGLAPKDEELMTTVTGAIRATFHEVGGEYDNPTKQTLSAVVTVLARKASAWGTPQEIVEHHRSQIANVLSALG